MQVQKERLNPTKVKLSVSADPAQLEEAKQAVLERLSHNLKVPGFRQGKAPLSMTEKNLDPTALQSEFLDEAINRLYVAAVEQEKLRPVAQPQINLTKFVPYTALEFTAEVEAVGHIKLPEYKKIKLTPTKVTVAAKDVDEVVENLRSRAAA